MSIMDRLSLKGRTALVTGAGRGIGYALAQALAEAGADVACVDKDGATARAAAKDFAKLGVRTMSIQAELTDKAQVQRMVGEIVAAWGQLDIAVNNAGIARGDKAEDMSEEAWDAVIAVNLKSVFLCCQAEAQVMLPRGYGKIINTVSMSASIVNRPQCQVNYNAAKAGALHVTKSCAAEWAARGVRVNAISPGHTLTPMTAGSPAEMRAEWVRNTPMGRLGDPRDLQGAVVYLASEASDYVTGLDLIVDGGYILW